MVLINYATKEIVAKIVYYGPALCGKTTNLQFIYTKLSPKKRGKMIALSTESDRTLFFDFLPMELGKIQGFKVRFQLYTVPGQVFYGATRRLVLKGADAVVFVADSQEAVMDMNVESIEDMKQNLIENNLDPETIPLVIQYNKRDLNGIAEVDDLQRQINWRGVPYTEAVAITGPGVMETFFEITKALIHDLKKKHSLMDTDAIKELPPDIFEPEKTEEVLEAEDIVFEIEHGSGYREEAEEEVVAGEMLDMMETISLADATQAEEFFDDVRKGIPTEEAREKVLSAGTDGEAIELSEAAMNIENEETTKPYAENPLRPGERELTPEELEFTGEPVEEPEPAPSVPEIPEEAVLEADPYIEPVKETAPTLPVTEPSKKQKSAAKKGTAKTKETSVKSAKPAVVETPQAWPRETSAVDEKRFSNIQETLALLAKDVSTLSVKLEKQASVPAETTKTAPAAEPDKRIDAVLEALTGIAIEITSLADRIDSKPAAGPVPAQGQDLTLDLLEIKESLARIEQETSALRLTLTMMKESTANALHSAQSSGGGDLKAELEELRKLFKDTLEGQDRLLLSILEASRETKQANNDAHGRLEDALRRIAGGATGDSGKKKMF
jgi:mutual gliding-motility protein MglA